MVELQLILDLTMFQKQNSELWLSFCALEFLKRVTLCNLNDYHLQILQDDNKKLKSVGKKRPLW